MSNQILGEIIGGYIIDEKGTKLNLGKISNVTFEQNVNYYDNLCCCSVPVSRNGTFTLEVEPDENGNLFTIETPKQEKGEKELMKRKVDFPNLDTTEFVSTVICEESKSEREKEEMNGTIVYCRFETAKGEFNEHTKTYAYYVAASPEDCLIEVGSIFKMYQANAILMGPEYNGTRLRCEEIIGISNKEDADLYANKTLKIIERVAFEETGEIISPNRKYVAPLSLKALEGARLKSKSLLVFSPKEASELNREFIEIMKGTDFKVGNLNDLIDFKEYDTRYAYGTYEENTNILGGNDMNTNMFGNMFKNMKFGKLETNDIKYSMKGIAFKTTDGDYVCYNPDFTFTNVANMVMDMPMFAMPVSKDQIKVGDVIDHNGTWVIVSDVTPSEIKVARPWTKEIVSVIPETSIFGFSFYTKVINPFESFGATATADNPFGNMLPLMLMSGGDIKNSNDMLMMMLAFGGGKIDFSNPMMMYMLMGDKSNTNDMLMMMMLSGNNPFEQKHECKCGCKAGDYVVTPNNSIDPCFGVDVDWTQFVPTDEIKIDVSAVDIETDK